MKKIVFSILVFIITFVTSISVYAVSDNECENYYERTGDCESLSGCEVLIKGKNTFCVAIKNENSNNSSNTYDNYSPGTVSCGNGTIKKIPSAIPKTISIIYTLLEVAIPIVLVIFGMLDLFKSITAQKEDEIKKGQQIFIKRLIAAAIVFFVFVIVKAVISIASDNNESVIGCAECFIKNNCD